MAGPSCLEEGSPYQLVTPRTQRDGRIFRPAVLVASALALVCVVATVVSTGSSRSVLQQTGVSSEVPLELMPDPAEAVSVAQETVNQVDPFHRDGSWIVPKEYDEHEVPKLVMEPRYAMREGQEAADHASRQPYSVPLSRNNQDVPGSKVAALGQYTPKRQISNNPLAQFIPNITYWPNGDIVPFWDGPCESDDVECMLWKAKGYENGDVVMPNPREHVDHDPWGLPLAKFGSPAMKSEDPMILGELGIEKEEEEQGVPLNVAESDARAILEEVAEASGLSPDAARAEAEQAVEDKNILEAASEGEESEAEAKANLVAEEQQSQATGIAEMQAQLAEQERISAESMAKQNELRTAMESITGEPAAGGVVEAAALQGEVPMVTTVGPAVGDLSGVVNSDVAAAPVASADVEMISPVFNGPSSAVTAPMMSAPVVAAPYSYTQAPYSYSQAGAIAGATAAMQQVRAARLQSVKQNT